jgi:hypothetical protein
VSLLLLLCCCCCCFDQLSCGFCVPLIEVPSAATSSRSSNSIVSSSSVDNSSSSENSTASSTRSSSSSSSSSSSPPGSPGQGSSAALDPNCYDELSVCPFFASRGLCSNGSLWLESQCPRSCNLCSTRQPLTGESTFSQSALALEAGGCCSTALVSYCCPPSAPAAAAAAAC